MASSVGNVADAHVMGNGRATCILPRISLKKVRAAEKRASALLPCVTEAEERFTPRVSAWRGLFDVNGVTQSL